jgi:peptidoglycan/xylan/chitin deacetylase (PgdA/CDA1 family)
MRYLKKHYRILPLASLPQTLALGGPGLPAVAITFDDGYVGTYTDAFPVLRRYAIPATTYATVDCIETGRLAWYDRVFLAFQVCAKNSFTLELDVTRRYELGSPAARLRAADDVNRNLRRLPDAQRREICRQIEERIPLPEEPMRGRMLNWRQAREMQDGGHSFGCHTMTHPALSQVEPRQYDYELVQSRQLLEQRIGRPAPDFAFPFGLAQDCGSVANLLPGLGYRTATTMSFGVNSPGVDLFRLHRASFADSVSTFACKLNWLFLGGGLAPAVSSRADDTVPAASPREA